jgi:hypothetical protein
VFPISNSIFLETLLLIGFGALAIFIRAKLRIPINIPGHHGIEVMALIIAGRRFSNLRFASSVSTLTAALLIFIPFMGFKDPFLPAVYIIMGLAIDLIYGAFPKWKENFLFISLLGGLAYLIIPLSRIIITLTTGLPYGSLFKHGFVAPVALHFLFGIIGAAAGVGLVKIFKRK